jgi:uncharacterized protein YjdB
MGIGATIITVTTLDGGFTDDCYIRVINPVTGIRLNKDSISLAIDGEETLKATVLPENASIKTVFWSSDNEAIATVDQNGKVKGISIGATVITATTLEGGFEATSHVTVVNAYTLPTGITLTPKTLSIDIDTDYPLVAEIKPVDANPTITWTSNAPAIVSVDSDGIVTALAAGKATITAKTVNGFSATCTITVTIPIDTILITPNELTLPLKGAKALKAEVIPSNATNKTVVWSSSNTAIATVSSSGTVTAKSVNGTVEIYATNTASGKRGVCIVTVGTGKSAPVEGLEGNLDDIIVYPNPTRGELRIENVEIFDLMGRSVGANNIRPNENEISIDISHLPSGVYFIRIQTENGAVTKKVVKR